MNDQLQRFARETMKTQLSELPADWQLTFKRMYSHADLSKSVDTIVENMPVEKLDWAMQQVQNSLSKLRRGKG